MQSHSLRSKKVQAVLLIRDGQLAAAKNLLEEIVQSDRHDADTWYMLASVNHRLGISWWVELSRNGFGGRCRMWRTGLSSFPPGIRPDL